MSYKYKKCPFCHVALRKIAQYQSTFACAHCYSFKGNHMFIQNSTYMELSTKNDIFYFILNWAGDWYIKDFDGHVFQSGQKKLTAKQAIKMLERYEKIGAFM